MNRNVAVSRRARSARVFIALWFSGCAFTGETYASYAWAKNSLSLFPA